jgi:hypothetical protein
MRLYVRTLLPKGGRVNDNAVVLLLSTLAKRPFLLRSSVVRKIPRKCPGDDLTQKKRHVLADSGNNGPD